MTFILVRKILRDLRAPLLVVCLLLMLFQTLWAKITQRVVGEIAPAFSLLTGGKSEYLRKLVDKVLFSGPGKMIQTIIGGETIEFDRAMDMLSIGYVHPLMQTVFCIWAIGRAAGAIAGEIDRGTMELLLAQPLARYRLLLAHLCVDGITIPILCLSLWAGNWIGYWAVGPIKVRPPDPEVMKMLPLGVTLPPADPERLRTDPAAFAPALLSVAALIFAVGGFTMWLSARGRFRWRVLGLAVFITLVQFLINLIGQMWTEAFGWMQPLTFFYYYQPQQIILGKGWCVNLSVWNAGQPLLYLPGALVLFLVGAVGYAGAFWTFCRRDLPAPL